MTAPADYGIAFTAREWAELLPIERDAAPLGPRDVAGRTLVTLISTGTELAIYQGEHFPQRPGYAAVFEVEAVGAEVADLAPGDRVFCMGPHQTFQRAARAEVIPVPAGMAPDVALFARMVGVTMSTLTTTTARPPEQVLVLGLGLVGFLAAQLFAACGYEVIACDPLAERRDLARQAGVERAIPDVPVDDPAIARKVGLALDCSGHEQAVLDACRVVRKRGEVVLVATPWRQRSDLDAHQILRAVFHNYVVMRSGWEWELPRQPTDFMTNSIYGSFAAAMRWLAEGRIRVAGISDTRRPQDAQDAYQGLLRDPGARLTTVFEWNTPRA
ncbi:MAG: zinc-binding dehydrogenase [Armatimonadota bacterium]|nr:MAG: zinc-binding dehydrogenase [Armatimonadota bacterium]